MKRKILIFSLTYYPNQVSGAEAAIKEITDRIDQKDIEFHMVTNRYDASLPKVERVGNILVHRIGIVKKDPVYEDQARLPLHFNKYLYQLLAAWKAIWLHQKYQYDGIWALMAHSAGVPAAIFKLFSPKVKFVLTLQEGDSIEYIEKTMRPLWPFFVRAFTHADVIQTISTYLANWAKARNASCPIEIIHNGGNPRDFKDNLFSKEEITALKTQLGKKEGDIFLVNTARLVNQKSNDTTIQALTKLPDNVKLLLVGGGVDEMKLKDLTRELGLEDRVIFIGPVDRSEVTKYRRISDIYVGPSRSEGLGNAFLSAMASRLPVVTTQEGGLAEFVFGEEKDPDKEPTAWVVDKEKPEQITEAVKDIISSPEKVTRITSNARKMVEEQYHWDLIARQMRERVFGYVFNDK